MGCCPELVGCAPEITSLISLFRLGEILNEKPRLHYNFCIYFVGERPDT